VLAVNVRTLMMHNASNVTASSSFTNILLLRLQLLNTA